MDYLAAVIKRALILTAGLCWILAAIGIAALAFAYLNGGAGLQLLGPLGMSISAMTVGIGTIHFIGFCLGAFLSFAVGVALCAYALVASQS